VNIGETGYMDKVMCRDYVYRHNIKMPGRTQYIVIRADIWEIVKPTRMERSRTGAHGKDVYCLEKSVWDKVIVVLLERTNSGKLSYEVSAPQEYWWDKVKLESVLMLAEDFYEMEEEVRKYVELQRSKVFEKGKE
jgi:hypothetical protein